MCIDVYKVHTCIGDMCIYMYIYIIPIEYTQCTLFLWSILTNLVGFLVNIYKQK